jgi:hypothetical protein
MRTRPPITITTTDEIPGNEYTDLKTAQRAALPALSDNLASVIRDLLECGVLVIRDGKIIPNPERSKDAR